MLTEIEAQFLDVDKEKIQGILKELKGERILEEILMRRRLYDYEDLRLYKQDAWVRVRDEGAQVNVSYKQLAEQESIEGMKEIEIVVDDFDKACALLEAIGMKAITYIETKREVWKLEGVKVMIETWPWVPSYMEIEGNSEEDVREVAKKMGFDWNKAKFGSSKGIYGYYFELTAEEINLYPEIVFGPVPELFEKRRVIDSR